MGRRRRGKTTVFVQRSTLEEESRVDILSDDESGGLHVGGTVICRAPLSNRTATRLPSSPQLPGSREAGACVLGPAQVQQGASRSDNSLNDELKDYLDNLEQHGTNDDRDSSSSDAAGQSTPAGEQAAEVAVQQLNDLSAMVGISAAGPTSRSGRFDADADVLFNSHLGLGYHPGLGFKDKTAATRFTAVGLDDALEGMLAQDMAGQQLGSTRSSCTDQSSSSVSNTSSDSSRESGREGTWHGGLGPSDVDPAATTVTDAQGRPIALWERLALQQRFPVLTRQHQQQGSAASRPQGAAGRPTSNRSRQGGKRQTPRSQRSRGAANTNSSEVEALMSSIRMPRFSSAGAATAAKAACVAAAAAADPAARVRQQERRPRRSAVPGGQGGQLLPGEKRKLRKEKIAAKRAVRQAEAGASALEVLAQLEEFVAAGGDMTLLPPAGKRKQAFARALASLYGVKATARGGGSSTSKVSLVLQSTSSMSLLDDDDTHSWAQLEALLTAEVARELTAVAIAAGPALRAQHKMHKGRSSQQGGHRHQGSRGAAAAADNDLSVLQQPVSFVPGGVLDPNIVRHKPVAVDAAQTGAASALDTATGTDVQSILMTDEHLVNEADAAAATDCPTVSRSAAEAGSTLLEPLVMDNAEQQQAAALTPRRHIRRHGEMQKGQMQLVCGDWMMDRQPHDTVDVDLESSAAVAAGDDVPVYDRAPLGLGCSISGLGYGLNFAAASTPAIEGAAAGGYHGSGGGQSGSHNGSRALRDLEDKFANLRAVTGVHAAHEQQRRQLNDRHHHQQWQEQRLLNPNTALGAGSFMVTDRAASAHIWSCGSADIACVEERHKNLTLGLTAQQVKKARRQKLRNERREARAAAAAAGDMQASTELIAAGIDHTAVVGNSFAAFEAHTTGIGSRLLGRWGWSEGQGLGRGRQGRAEPLQAARRPRQLGLGAE